MPIMKNQLKKCVGQATMEDIPSPFFLTLCDGMGWDGIGCRVTPLLIRAFDQLFYIHILLVHQLSHLEKGWQILSMRR